jgi:hypothetical protein
MNKDRNPQNPDAAVLLKEMERYLLNASPSEVEEILAELGLTEKAAEVSKNVTRALDQDYSRDLTRDSALPLAALVKNHTFFKGNSRNSRLRLRFLLAAYPDLAGTLSVDVGMIDSLSDDVVRGLYERAIQIQQKD